MEGPEAALRHWFHRLTHARENPATLTDARHWVEQLLDTVPTPAEAAWAGDPSDRISEGTDAEWPGPSLPSLDQPDLLSFHAPLALLEGAWLQSVAVAGNSHLEAVNRLLACQLTLLGRDEADSPAFAYRAWLGQCQLGMPEVTAWQFAQDPRIGAPALYFSCLQLALGLHAASFFPEVLGFTLAYSRSGSPWKLPALPPPQRNAILAALARQLAYALQTFPAGHPQRTRIGKGFALYQQYEGEYCAGLRRFSRIRPGLGDSVADIFRRKLRFARGYHAGVQLGGRGLEQWLDAHPFDAQGFLAAFASSVYCQGDQGQRPFDRLTDFGGPMFGVFAAGELELINAWLEPAKLGDKAQSFRVEIPSPSASAIGQLPQGDREASLNAVRLTSTGRCLKRIDHRRLYHLLINRDGDAKTLSLASQQVARVLAGSRRKLNRRGPLPSRFFDYAPEALAGRIEQIHQMEATKHRPFRPPPSFSREEYVWGIRQFAPAILVDGCWLQHLGEAACQHRRTQRLLHRIYAQELGEGRIDWNHPKIYRDLLDDLGIALPPVESIEFARHPGFADAAFDLPAYLLAISQFPRTYFPEILGLNLAIELSGLGGGYQRLADELRHWAINPLIVTLHLSIDNLAGGHAAMACEAIQSYLDETLSLGGTSLQQESWRRIWSGYLSLQTATQRFKWALLLGFCRHFLPQRCLRMFRMA